MRLICPNCGAQYEVPDEAIPESGRDVQCSNCGHTWFERPGESLDAEDEPWPEDRSEEEAVAAEPAPGIRQAEDAAEVAAEPAGEAAPVPDVPEPPEDVWDEPPEPPGREERPTGPEWPGSETALPAEESRLARRRLDPEIANVLREEREHSEALRRRREPPAPFESQGDLALEDRPAAPRPRQADGFAPEHRPEEPDLGTEAGLEGRQDVTSEASRRESRRDLPDVDELNSSLSQRTLPANLRSLDRAEERAREGRRGFRLGFGLVLLIAAVAALAYLQADTIGSAIPALAGPLVGYVDAVDAGRLWLDASVRGLLDRVEGGA